jgi:uncharacterized membrane protein
MNEIVSFLLGADKVVLAPGSTWEFSFATPWSVLWFVLAGLVIAAGVVSLYWRETVPLTGAQRTFFVAMRLLIVLVVLTMLGEPSIFVSTASEGRAVAALLVDTSESMGVRDAYQDQDQERRAARAARLLAPQTPKTADLTDDERRRLHELPRAKIVETALRDEQVRLLQRLAEYYDVAVYAFDSTARQVAGQAPEPDPSPAGPSPAAPGDQRTPDPSPAARGGGEVQTVFRLPVDAFGDPTGKSTDFGAAVRTAIKDARSRQHPLAAVILFSDGRPTAGEPLAAVAAYARQSGVPLLTVAVGDPNQPKDVKITALLVNNTVFADDPTQISFVIESAGYDGERARVELLEDDKLLTGKDVPLLGGERQQRETFSIKPSVPGKHTYTVQVRPIPGELIEANNSASALVDVIKGKIKVLYIEGLPRWEYRFLKNALMRDESLLVSCLLASAEFDFIQEGNLPIDRFPTREEDLFKYNVIILGDVDPTMFTERQMELMRDFVERLGGGIIFQAGEKFMPRAFRNTELRSVVPVDYDTGRDVGVNAAGIKVAYRWDLTEEGKDHPVLLLADDPQESLRLWPQLPGLFWHFPARRAKPGATVLAQTRGRDGAAVPLVVTSFYGAGRVAYVGVDETWRWRYGVEDKYFYRFWGQLLRYVNLSRQIGQSQRFQLTTYKPEYAVGEEVMIRARLLDRTYRPLDVKEAEATVLLPGGEELKVLLQRTEAGVFEGALRAVRPGIHEVRLTSPRPELEGEKATFNFLVKRPDIEFRNTRADPEALLKLAQNTGGQAYPIDELGTIADSLRAQRRIRVEHAQFPLWDAPIFFIVFFAAICGEWIYRKRQRLL